MFQVSRLLLMEDKLKVELPHIKEVQQLWEEDPPQPELVTKVALLSQRLQSEPEMMTSGRILNPNKMEEVEPSRWWTYSTTSHLSVSN